MNVRTVLLGLSALFVAFNAAFFSVTGLSHLFAGASIAVLIMASSLELAKLIAASFVYHYWERLNLFFKSYLVLAITVLVLITSAGIYGFLSSAYQKTADQMELVDGQTMVLQNKRESFQLELDGLVVERNRLNNEITQFVTSMSTIEPRFTSARRTLESQINQSRSQLNIVNAQISTLNDSISVYRERELEVKTNSNISSEIGPLKFIADLTGVPMNVIVNILILCIVFVFDPLAITLVIAYNFALKQSNHSPPPPPTPVYPVLSTEPPPDVYETPSIQENLIQSEPTSVVGVEYDTESDTHSVGSLTRTLGRVPIDLDGDGVTDGYDTNGDGIVDEYTPEAYRRTDLRSKVPYYMLPTFDWTRQHNWKKDPAAVNYWITHIYKPK